MPFMERADRSNAHCDFCKRESDSKWRSTHNTYVNFEDATVFIGTTVDSANIVLLKSCQVIVCPAMSGADELLWREVGVIR